ncbi:DUF4326 domain-containing protein [Methylobacterium gnaphalii]|uniref:DUF4326 domain-containing protein n=1 Tax=Methylobacterium gnaphalii TaxID=1010610 RepID=A0A512JQN5_9HYPH|nr:DUF4326 domain-containing protein [Methylobacterium gnaphalii]GEP12275.1 hypothetical protein MGN01_41200 [Methylobacterium gnaphalii]GJD68722.1 hypothetical protein MMMDOFMJ_1646 [Methylobacterium gnaphalii]GLS49382.1 hypothetical protein GCM10007885_22300 [Methylobacterium gnaphalii]
MRKPVRLRLSRIKGFRLQELSRAVNGLPAVRVARPGMWGNYAAVRCGTLTGEPAVAAFRRWIEDEASDAWKGVAKVNLRGRNLACFCRLDAPCHADVLLEMANAPICEAIEPTRAA